MPSFTSFPTRGPIIGCYPLMLLPHSGLNGRAPLGQSVSPITTPEGRWRPGRGMVVALHCVFVWSGDEVWIPSFLYPTLIWLPSATADTVAEPDTWLRNKPASQNGSEKKRGWMLEFCVPGRCWWPPWLNWDQEVSARTEEERRPEGSGRSPPAHIHAHDQWICNSSVSF